MSYLALPWLMTTQTESKMLWYSECDLEPEENEQVRKGIAHETGLEWTCVHMKGIGKKIRRSPRKQLDSEVVKRGIFSQTSDEHILLKMRRRALVLNPKMCLFNISRRIPLAKVF